MSHPDNYLELPPGELCYTHHFNIQSEGDCKAAAQSLGLQWGKAWVGPGDHPGCLHTTDSRNKVRCRSYSRSRNVSQVYYNLSPVPNTVATKGYLSICRSGENTHGGTDALQRGTERPHGKTKRPHGRAERPQRGTERPYEWPLSVKLSSLYVLCVVSSI